MRSLVRLGYLRRDTPNFLSTMHRPKPRSKEYLFITMASSISYLGTDGSNKGSDFSNKSSEGDRAGGG